MLDKVVEVAVHIHLHSGYSVAAPPFHQGSCHQDVIAFSDKMLNYLILSVLEFGFTTV